MSKAHRDPPASQGPADDIERLLEAAAADPVAREQLVMQLYPELRRIAEYHMRRERPDHTLQATALVSEFFLQVATRPGFRGKNRSQFLIAASVAMRRFLVDYARARKREKRGGQWVRVEVDAADPGAGAHDAYDLLLVDELLGQLATEDERMAQVVELRFFGGLTNAEISEVLGVHERTVKRDWQVARAWLYQQLRAGSDGDGAGLGTD